MDSVKEPLSVFSAIIPENVEPPREMTETVSVPETAITPDVVSEPIKMCNCESCEKNIQLSKANTCKWCDSDYDSDDDDDSDDDVNTNKKPPHLFCKNCTRRCFVCEVRGCIDCVSTVCCDCSERMCRKCRNGDELCGCYGHCYSCGTDVNRGSDGWPCGECDRWLCSGCCRSGDNPCPECGPGEEDESE